MVGDASGLLCLILAAAIDELGGACTHGGHPPSSTVVKWFKEEIPRPRACISLTQGCAKVWLVTGPSCSGLDIA